MTALLARLRRAFSFRLAAAFVAAGGLVALVGVLAADGSFEEGLVVADDGLRIAYEALGDGPPLVALAGGPGIGHHGFHPYVDRLADVARIVYLDPRGRGRSDEAERYRVADDVADVEALRRGLGLERIDLLGASYGAHLAVAYAVAHPERTGRLVLVGPLVGARAWRAHVARLRETLAAAGIATAGRRLADPLFRRRALAALEPLYRCPATPAPSVFRPWHHVPRQNFRVYEDLVGPRLGTLTGDLARSTLDERLDAVRAPALVVVGSCDRVVPEGHARRLAERLGARLAVLGGAGHAPYADAPVAFIAACRRFLAAAPR